MSNLHQLSAAAAAAAIVDGSVSPVALVDACLARIRQRDGEILAWVHVDEAGARKAAREREAEAREKKFRGPLHGVPVAIKDIIDVAAMPTTCGAAAFAHRQPAEDAACIARLRAVGAIILGKVATTEFVYFEPAATRNPWNTAHTPGGSSSGSAASVAARMVPLALGSQTVGSVLRPAAYCGVVGFKGTFAAIPTDGVNPLAQSLDHVGIFAREVADIRLAFAILSGSALRQSALPPHFALAPELIERASAEVAASVRAAADRLAAAGATVSEIALPKSFAGIHAAGRAVMEGEFAASQEALHRDHAADYRPRTRALIESGLAQKTTTYVGAQHERAQFRHAMAPLLSSAILLAPTAPATAPKGLESTGDPWFCAPWSFIGVPAISLPTTVGPDGLPHAIQLVAAGEGDADLLGAAAWCEGVLGFSARPPE